jgi:hypothetical protein
LAARGGGYSKAARGVSLPSPCTHVVEDSARRFLEQVAKWLMYTGAPLALETLRTRSLSEM